MRSLISLVIGLFGFWLYSQNKYEKSNGPIGIGIAAIAIYIAPGGTDPAAKYLVGTIFLAIAIIWGALISGKK